MKNRIIITTIILFFHINTWSQQISNFLVSFSKTDDYPSRVDNISGKLLYFQGKTTVFIQQPIQQVLLFYDNLIVVYYPQDTAVLRINTQSQAFLPFFQMFVGIVNQNFNPEALGFQLHDQQFNNDTLKFIWLPPNQEDIELGMMETVYHKDKLALIQNFGTNNKMTNSVHYSGYEKVYETEIPFKIEMNNYFSVPLKETIVFEVLETSSDAIERYKDFSVPLNAKIKEIAW